MGLLHDAAKKLDIAEVKRLLAEGADVKEFDDKGRTPLHSLITNYLVFGDSSQLKQVVEIMDALLDAGADINAKETKGQKRTVLHSAAELTDAKLIKHLLNRGADVHSTTYFDDTPLHLAAKSGSVQDRYNSAELLLKRGASINAVNNTGFKPTTWTYQEPKLHALLLQYGVPSTEKTKAEKELDDLYKLGAKFFIKPEESKVFTPRRLTDIAAEKAVNIRYKLNSNADKSTYYQNLLKLQPEVRKVYPELECDYRRLFVHKMDKILERGAEKLNPKDNEKELSYLNKIKGALGEKNPYNAVHGVITEMDKEMKQGFLSTFKDNMSPVRNQIVTAMKEYNADKALYNKYVGSSQGRGI